MRKKLLIVALVATMAVGTASAGGPDAMAEMMNCSICKNLAAHMEELGPAMKSECIEMNNGMAMVHQMTDEAKVEKFHSACSAMREAGTASMKYTDAEAGENLCRFCQGIRGLMAAGASMSSGDTANGSLMVISSDDAEVQAKIAVFYKQATEMMGSS